MTDTEASTVVDICQQLDLLVVRYFQTLADLFKCKQLLESDMKDGFFYMAKVTIDSAHLYFCAVSVSRCMLHCV